MALVQSHRSRKTTEAIQAYRNSRKDVRKALKKQRDQVQAWEESHTVGTAMPQAETIIPTLASTPLLPAGTRPDTLTKPLRVCRWEAPLSSLIQKLLSATNLTEEHEATRKELEKAWNEKCAGIRAADCKAITAPVKKLTICFMANRCLCSDERGKNVIRFVQALSRCLHSGRNAMLAKGSAGRQLYNRALAVLRVHRKGKDLELRAKDYWMHLGWSNFNNQVHHILRLLPCVATLHGEWDEITLEADVSGGPVNLWVAFLGIDLDKNWDAEIWQVYDSNDQVRTDFVPKFVSLKRCPINGKVSSAKS